MDDTTSNKDEAILTHGIESSDDLMPEEILEVDDENSLAALIDPYLLTTTQEQMVKKLDDSQEIYQGALISVESSIDEISNNKNLKVVHNGRNLHPLLTEGHNLTMNTGENNLSRGMLINHTAISQ